MREWKMRYGQNCRGGGKCKSGNVERASVWKNVIHRHCYTLVLGLACPITLLRCLVAQMDQRIALVPCGHGRYCGPYVLKRCTTEESVVICVEVRFRCFCVCFNCVSRFSRIIAKCAGKPPDRAVNVFPLKFRVRCAVTFNLDICLLDDVRWLLGLICV